jgi:hypothetical protein
MKIFVFRTWERNPNPAVVDRVREEALKAWCLERIQEEDLMLNRLRFFRLREKSRS